ncbi:MAG: hypothetical protein ABL986_23785 [Vicinamibacterales bacterium]
MSMDTVSLSELATRLTDASPMESLALAREISERFDTLRPQLAERLKVAESVDSVARESGALDEIVKGQQQLLAAIGTIHTITGK